MKMAEAFVSVCLYLEQCEIEENVSRCWRRNMRCFSGKEQRWPKSSFTRIDPLNISFPPYWRSGKLIWAILSWEEMVDLMWRRAVGLDPFPPSVRRVILGGRAKGMVARPPSKWDTPYPPSTLSTVPLQGHSIRIAESDTPFGICECAQSYVIAWFRNLKACGGFGVRGFRDTRWCNPVTLPVLAVNQHAWRSQASGKAAFHSFLCLQV